MKLGLVSAILEDYSFEQLIDYAAENRLQSVEVACWPKGESDRRYAGVTHIDVEHLDGEKARSIQEYARNKKIEIAALAYYPNVLDADEMVAKNAISHLIKVIEAAAMLDVGIVTTFIGRDHRKTLEENLALVKRVWQPILDVAESKNVKIAIENCPMLFTEDEWPGGKNLMTSPSNWRKIFTLLDSPYLGLNFDPSHFVWQQMDYIQPIYDFKDKLFFVHFKDLKVYPAKLNEVGTMATPLEYMAPKLLGYGDIQWGRFVSALTDIQYTGPSCIEVEDKAFEDSPEDVKRGIEHCIRYIETYL